MMKPTGLDMAQAFAAVNPNPVVKTATIANAGSLSPAVDLGSGRLVAIVFPAAWTAAPVTLMGTADGTNYFDLWSSAGAEISLTWVVSKLQALDPNQYLGITGLKVRSGPTAAPVAQGAARDFLLVTQG